MTKTNNLKQIREIYGATQEQIAKALGVNRVTVANWENGSSTASSTNREKLSIYYGIGPEFFYDQDLNDTVKEMIIDTANKARQVVKDSNGQRNKEEEFNAFLGSISFSEAMQKYMISMKVLLAVSDIDDIEKLKTALLVNQKMGNRLESIIKIKEAELEQGQPSLSELMETFQSE